MHTTGEIVRYDDHGDADLIELFDERGCDEPYVYVPRTEPVDVRPVKFDTKMPTTGMYLAHASKREMGTT